MAAFPALDALQERLRDHPLDLDAVLAEAIDESARLLGADRGTLFLVDHGGGGLLSRAGHLPEGVRIRLRPGQGLAGWVLQNGQGVCVPSLAGDPRFFADVDAETGYRTRTLVAVPVPGTQAPAGVLQFLNKVGGGVFSAEDLALAGLIAGRLARLLDGTSLGPQLQPGHPRPLAFRFNGVVGDSPALRAAFDKVGRAARTDATVLLRGESGTGKELLARAVHDNSARAGRPFVVVDLGALPADLMENELFGHRRGAFTGADRDFDGRVAAAEGGTLFLDEVGEVPLPVQTRLLRLLQERSYTPVGDTRARAADVRFVCATHRDLRRLVDAGRFREDLYYRLRVVEIEVPPLRARGADDIDRLADHFLATLGARYGRPGLRWSAEARARLQAWPWPGNVRELRAAVESAVVLAPDGPLGPEVLGLDAAPTPAADGGPAFTSPPVPLDALEAAYCRWMLDHCGGSRTEAARRLGIGRNTLLRKLEG